MAQNATDADATRTDKARADGRTDTNESMTDEIPASDLDTETPAIEEGATVTLAYDSRNSSSDDLTTFTGDVTHVGDRGFWVEQGDSTTDGSLRWVATATGTVKAEGESRKQTLGRLDHAIVEHDDESSGDGDADDAEIRTDGGTEDTTDTPLDAASDESLKLIKDLLDSETDFLGRGDLIVTYDLLADDSVIVVYRRGAEDVDNYNGKVSFHAKEIHRCPAGRAKELLGEDDA